MAIVQLKKLTLCGLLTEKQQILESLQQLGGSHLISLNNGYAKLQSVRHESTEVALAALKYLNQCVKKRHQIHHVADFNMAEVVQKVSSIQAEMREVGDRRDFLIDRIAEIEPWGDFQLGDLGDIKFWFYIVPKRLMKKLDEKLVYQIVHTDNIHHYVVVLSAQEPELSSVPVPRTHTGKVPLSQLKKQLQEAELRLEDLQAERESLTRWIALLSINLFKTQDLADLKAAGNMTLDNENVFVVQAWVPEDQLDRYQQFAQQHHLATLWSGPDLTDRPPTLLSNKEQLAGGEEVTGFYQTPGYFDWDPSIVVFFSFALFFAMILSDAGYAAAFAVLLAIKWRKMGASITGQRLRMLAFVTVLFSLVWGVLSGGYFGYTPPEYALMATVKMVDLNDFDSMMKLSIAVGTLHISLASLVKAYQNRHRMNAFSSIGWALLAVGGYGYWLTNENAGLVLLYTAYSLMGVGLFAILFFSGSEPFTKPLDLLWHFLSGIKSLTGITKLFGDILSYMRLFALGLASASLAVTFNQLAMQVYYSVSGVGLLFSILILVLGHSLNLVLCLMSGVVHGLRLNFIEFYNWSVSDEGYPFKAFTKRGEN
jgi:V/A-type H+/Na+-transporting ATPase subunit I